MACTPKTLHGIAQNCEGNLGGISAVYIIDHQYVTAIATGITDENTEQEEVTGITVASGHSFIKYYVRKNTSSLTKTLNIQDNGGSYVTSDLALVFSRMDAQKRLEMNALAQNDLIVIALDANGIYWLLGSLENPVTMSAGGGETGVQKSDNNQYTTTLTYESADFPYTIKKDVAEGLLGL